MTDYQDALVLENLDLVNWVIRTRISIPNRPLLTYDDFYAIGCEAICRAALKYQPDMGAFAPFACRYIYNAIVDHCRAMNYRLERSVEISEDENASLLDMLTCTSVDFDETVTDATAMLTSASNAMKTSMPLSKAEIRDDRKEDLFMGINRGDVFYVNRSETIGSEQRSGRPAIIVSNPECNEHSPVVEVVYLTCQYKKPMPTHVRIESIGRRSTALCEQITSVDVSRLGDYKGHLTDGEMEQVDMALMKSLGIHPLTQQAKVEPVGPSVDDAALAMIALRFLEGFLQKRCGVEISGSICSGLLGQKQR